MAKTHSSTRVARPPVTLEPGFRSGRLRVVQHIAKRHGDGHRMVVCDCDCGERVAIPASYIKTGKRRSCGCGKRVPKTHGHTCGRRWSRTYRAWSNMRTRCSAYAKPEDSRLYVERGITVCDQWSSFEVFLADMGECPGKLTLDRIDNDGNYEPGNCRWTDMKTQHRNKRTNHVVTWRGRAMTIAELAERSSINAKCLWMRLVQFGWSVEKAATTPVGPAHNTKKRKR